jgi:opacity protein-like surface antigen
MIKVITGCIAFLAMAPAAHSTDWGGFYGGTFLSVDNGTWTGNIGGTAPFANRTTGGSFAGYNVDRGSWVYGVEVAYDVSGMKLAGAPATRQTHYIDLKGRAGYEIGNALLYGTAGVSVGRHSDNGSIYSQTGYVVGVGVDYKLTDHSFIGIEVSSRKIGGTQSGNPALDITSEIRSVALRFGMVF